MIESPTSAMASNAVDPSVKPISEVASEAIDGAIDPNRLTDQCLRWRARPSTMFVHHITTALSATIDEIRIGTTSVVASNATNGAPFVQPLRWRARPSDIQRVPSISWTARAAVNTVNFHMPNLYDGEQGRRLHVGGEHSHRRYPRSATSAMASTAIDLPLFTTSTTSAVASTAIDQPSASSATFVVASEETNRYILAYARPLRWRAHQPSPWTTVPMCRVSSSTYAMASMAIDSQPTLLNLCDGEFSHRPLPLTTSVNLCDGEQCHRPHRHSPFPASVTASPAVNFYLGN